MTINPLKLDPSRTTMLRRACVREMDRRIRQLQKDITQLVYEDDVFGLRDDRPAVFNYDPDQPRDAITTNVLVTRGGEWYVYSEDRTKKLGGPYDTKKEAEDRLAEIEMFKHMNANAEKQAWRFRTNTQKLDAFNKWFASQVKSGALQVDATGKPWMAKYVESAYKKGAIRAYTDSYPKAMAKTEDFYMGSRKQFLDSAFARPESTEKVRFLYTRAYEELKGVTATMGQQMSRVLADGIVHGKGAMEVARLLNKTIGGITKARAETIARTELIAAHAEGQLDAFEELGVEEVGVMAEWSTAGDGKVCELCSALEGVVIPVGQARGMIPRHPNCVRGDMVIESPGAVALMKSHYTGKIIEFITAKGRVIAVTENHVLLTDCGFAPAHAIHNGMYLIHASFSNARTIQHPYDDACIPCIADVFTSLSEDKSMLSNHMPLSPEDLHGDGKSCNAEIHIIWPNCELGDQPDVRFTGKRVEQKLPSFKIGRFEGCASVSSSATEFFERVLLAPRSIMSSLGIPSVFSRGSAGHHKTVRSQVIPWRHSGVGEPAVDGVSTALESVCECVGAHTLVEEGDYGFGGQHKVRGLINLGDVLVHTEPEVNPSMAQALGDEILSNAEHLCDLGGTGSCLVEADEIIRVNIIHVNHSPIYDASTRSTLYMLNGIVSSNCRCSFIPANISDSETGQKRGRKALTAIHKSIVLEKPNADTLREAKSGSRWVGKELDEVGEDPTDNKGDVN